MSIVVFTKPESLGVCPQCNRAKGFLKTKGVEYKEEDITNSATIEKLKENHEIYMAPVVALLDDETGDVESFHMGFVPGKINELISMQSQSKEARELVGAAVGASGADEETDIWDF